MTWMTLTGAGGGGAPSWLLRDPDTGGLPALDIDYAGGRAFKTGSVVDLAGLHTVSRASGGYAENLDGSLTWFGNNVMRRTDRGVLVESARTNLLLRSQEFDNAVWTKDSCTIIADSALAPDGTLTADSLVEAVSGAVSHRVRQAVTISSGATVTVSVVAKANARGEILLGLLSDSNYVTTYYTVSSGSIRTSVDNVGSIFSARSASISALANGWYRCVLSATTSGATAVAGIIDTSNGTTNVYPGDGVSGVYVWGAQLEAAAFASSYIPTGASAATRAADNVALTDFAGLGYVDAAGSAFVDAVLFNPIPQAGRRDLWAFTIAAGTENVRLMNEASTSNARFIISDGGVGQAAINPVGNFSDGVPLRNAAAWALNDVATSTNGGTVATDGAATMPTPDRLHLGHFNGASSANGYIRRFAYFKRRISNAGLQALAS